MAFICEIHSEISDRVESDQQVHRFTLASASIGIAVLAGLFLPLPVKVVDVLIILSLSLTVAMVLITLSVKTVSEMSGFDQLISATTLLRTFLLTICCRLILTEGYSGIIVDFVNKTIRPDNKVFVILILPLLAGIVFTYIYRFANKVSRIATDFICNIIPRKHRHVEKELYEGLIDQEQAKELRSIIKHEKKLFTTLEKASKYMYYDGIVELILILLCFVIGIIIGTVGRTIWAVSTKTYIYLSLGTIITIQVPALISALAFRFLVQKKYDELVKIVKSQNPSARRINVVSCEVEGTKTIKSQLQEKVVMQTNIKHNSIFKPKQSEKEISYKRSRIFSEEMPITEELEWIEERESPAEHNKSMLWSLEEIKDHYDDVAELIKLKCKGKLKTILMGSNSPKTLPVTVPVNTAIKLAKNGRKCLLIDLDYQRDSIARVFEVYKNILNENIPSGQTITGIPTCVQNLWLYPACWLTEFYEGATKLDSSKINQIITNLKTKYEYFIVYSPDLNKHQGCELIGECIDGAMLFGNESSNLSKTFELLEKFECEIIKPQQICIKVS
ncbi:MAG: FHIPEP family type III secretion protein [Planctomycetota bacterium]|jgi:Mrp family chromosome partitioning ATPase